MKHEERQLEMECARIARKYGCAFWKNENNGNKGIPDDSLLTPGGAFYLVEFKTTTGRLSREQQQWRERYPNIIVVCRSADDFEKFVKGVVAGSVG